MPVATLLHFFSEIDRNAVKKIMDAKMSLGAVMVKSTNMPSDHWFV